MLRWHVICDDERWAFKTRAKAREWTDFIRWHPANVSIRQYGGYLNTDGKVRVERIETFPQCIRPRGDECNHDDGPAGCQAQSVDDCPYHYYR